MAGFYIINVKVPEEVHTLIEADKKRTKTAKGEIVKRCIYEHYQAELDRINEEKRKGRRTIRIA